MLMRLKHKIQTKDNVPSSLIFPFSVWSVKDFRSISKLYKTYVQCSFLSGVCNASISLSRFQDKILMFCVFQGDSLIFAESCGKKDKRF